MVRKEKDPETGSQWDETRTEPQWSLQGPGYGYVSVVVAVTVGSVAVGSTPVTCRRQLLFPDSCRFCSISLDSTVNVLPVHDVFSRGNHGKKIMGLGIAGIGRGAVIRYYMHQ